MSKRRPRDKDKTVEDVLTAAKGLFGERGLHGTSVRDLEKASGVSKGLILHHFGTKEGLYAAVQDLLNQEYIEMMDSGRQESQDLEALIRSAIRNSLVHTRENRAYRRIALWSYLEGQERTTELEQRFMTALMRAMRAGQDSGLVREDIDPFLMPFIIKGAIDYWIRRQGLIQELAAAGEDQEGPSDERLIEVLVRLVLRSEE